MKKILLIAVLMVSSFLMSCEKIDIKTGVDTFPIESTISTINLINDTVHIEWELSNGMSGSFISCISFIDNFSPKYKYIYINYPNTNTLYPICKLLINMDENKNKINTISTQFYTSPFFNGCTNDRDITTVVELNNIITINAIVHNFSDDLNLKLKMVIINK